MTHMSYCEIWSYLDSVDVNIFPKESLYILITENCSGPEGSKQAVKQLSLIGLLGRDRYMNNCKIELIATESVSIMTENKTKDAQLLEKDDCYI